jgi:putative spermidine/putrescine transport system substrate-binding protein
MLTQPAQGKLTRTQTDYLTGIPTLHNGDTLGIRPDLVGRPITTWADLLAPEYKGKTAVCSAAAICMADAASALEAAGRVKYVDKGDVTRSEIDATVAALTEFKKAGHFRAFWASCEESINLMAGGEVVIQSMWSPAVTAVRSQSIPCVYQSLKEGYRCWSSFLMVNSRLKGMALDAVYEYLTWYHNSGLPGALLLRQGYYTAVPDPVRKLVKPEEWGYWMEGKPAAIDIVDPYGHVIEKAGAARYANRNDCRCRSNTRWKARVKPINKVANQVMANGRKVFR